MLAAMFGVLVGMTGSDLAAAPGVITRTNEQVRGIFAAVVASDNQFSPAAMWLFVSIVAVLCIPAFFERGVIDLDESH